MTQVVPYQSFPNSFKRDLLAGKKLIGCWSSLANPITAEVLGLAGFDWVLLDGESAEEARSAVVATRYPPQGIRGVSVSQRSNRYGSIPDYFTSINDHICVMVQIESLAGVAAVKDIAAVEGVDSIFVGPSDLAAALGHLGNSAHPEVQTVIARVFADAKAAGKPVGILAPVEAQARNYMAMGATFVGVGSDLGTFRAATQALCDRYRD
jgi:2-dehydro-3-deoxyglucarate aldolase